MTASICEPCATRNSTALAPDLHAEGLEGLRVPNSGGRTPPVCLKLSPAPSAETTAIRLKTLPPASLSAASLQGILFSLSHSRVFRKTFLAFPESAPRPFEKTHGVGFLESKDVTRVHGPTEGPARQVTKGGAARAWKREAPPSGSPWGHRSEDLDRESTAR